MMSSSNTTAKTSSKSLVQPVFTYKKVLLRLCLTVICSSFIGVFLLIPTHLLRKFVALCNNEVPEIMSVLRTWLTPAFFFVLLNMMIAVILIQSDLFASTEIHSSSIHEERECFEKVSSNLESSENWSASANTVVPKSEIQATSLENSCEKIDSQDLILKSKDSEATVSTFRSISQKSPKSATKAKLSRSTRSEPKLRIKKGHERVVKHEVDELHERIEAFIAKARQQMRQQEQQA